MTEQRTDGTPHTKWNARNTRMNDEVNCTGDEYVQSNLIAAPLSLASALILTPPDGTSHLVRLLHSTHR